MIQSVVEWFLELVGRAVEVWMSGGWAMLGIAAIALVMFSMGVNVFLRLRRTGFGSVSGESWRRWIDHPKERNGPIGRLLDFVTGGRTLEDTAVFFDELRATETAPFERDLRVMKVCVAAAPLVGLLGTVMGMLGTFGALAMGSGGDKTMGLVASGISEALITTETGLVIALPGLFFQYRLKRRFQRYQAFLAKLESACTQTHYRRIGHEERGRIQRAARERIAEVLYRGLHPEGAAS